MMYSWNWVKIQVFGMARTIWTYILAKFTIVFYFDCYNSYAYNLLSARKFIGKKMAEVEPEDYGFYDKIIPGETKLSRSEFYAWSCCLYLQTRSEKNSGTVSN